MSRRREFPPKVRVQAFDRAGGHCECCTRKLMPGDAHYDHVVPDALGGEPTIDNCAVLCRACHGAKTAGKDVPAIAKAKRVERKHLGCRPTPSRPLPGSKASGWKHKVNGEWVRR